VERLCISLLAQTNSAFEVILADQNQDNRLSVSAKCCKSSQVKSSQVKSSQVKSSQVKSSQVKSSQVKSITHVRLEKPDQYAARTAGVERAKGKYIAFPDDDCWYEPEANQDAINILKLKKWMA